MPARFFTVHVLVHTFPYHLELALAGLLVLGWLLGRIRLEYNALVQHSSRAALVVVSVCGCAGWLLTVSLLLDSVWFLSPARLLPLGVLLALVLVIGSVCQALCLRAARRQLEADGYERGYLPILPKQRG